MTQEVNGQKPEKKWYLKKRMFVVYAILVLILIGSLGGSKDSTSGSTTTNTAPKEEVWTQVTTLKGKGNQNSESFDVTSDKVRITATTTGSSVGSYSGISLEKEDGGYTGPGLSIMTEGSEAGKGQTTYRTLKPGRYFIQVISGVNWQVTVEQTN